MNCPQADHIERYIQGQLNEVKSTDIERHLKNCSSCHNKVIEGRKNESLLLELHTFDAKDTLVSISKDLHLQAVDTGRRAQELLGEQYQVIRKVGQGASGVVFQVLDTVLDRQAAVKFLNKNDTADNTSEHRWREARLVGKLNHPNIAQIYHIGEEQECRFIVMEWVDGRPLTEAWHDMELEQRLGVFLQVLDGIAAAHRRGIVHRDIKPSNILVGGDGKAKILDFGIAVDTQLLGNVESRFYHGTPAFSAPEQITPPVKISTATDVFALGVLLYNLLTDTLPFPQTDQSELFHAIKTLYPELPGAVQEKVPISLQNICLKSLEKGPHQRYPDAQSLSEDINRYLRGEKVWSRPSFLTDKIQQEVFYHRQKLKVWNDNELITQSEFDKLENIYERVISPPDPSIIEARKLSFSQVCLYLGGWIVAIGCFVLFYQSWDLISMYWRPAPAIAATIFISVFGIVMWRKNENRLAVGFLATANLLIPITILLTMGQWQILNPDTYPLGTESVGTIPGAEITIGNWQLLFSSIVWFICSLFFLRMVRSSIFMILSIMAFSALLTTVYTIGGMEFWDQDTVAGRYLFPGVGVFILGSFLDRRKLIKYAWPLCVTGLLSIIIPLSVIAISDNTLFMWLWPGSGEPPVWYGKIISVLIESDDEAQLLSFLFNGIIYLALARICRLQGTRLQRRLATILNWLGPIHILAPLRLLDDLGPGSRELIYRILLPIASFAFVFGSVTRQMKSFFFSGLAGIAIAVHKLTDEYLENYFAWPVSLIVCGMMWMFFSWFVPRWKVSKALKHKK